MKRDARRELNRESLELWLATRGQHNSTRPPSHPDEYHGRVGKRGSRVGQDDIWLQAISQPDTIITDQFFETALDSLNTEERAALLSYGANPALHAALRHDYERGVREILDLADKEWRVLYWPSPDDAKGYVEANVRK